MIDFKAFKQLQSAKLGKYIPVCRGEEVVPQLICIHCALPYLEHEAHLQGLIRSGAESLHLLGKSEDLASSWHGIRLLLILRSCCNATFLPLSHT